MTGNRPPGPTDRDMGAAHYAMWRVDPCGLLHALTERYGNHVGFTLGRTPVILVNDASSVRTLLQERWDKLRKPEFLKDSNRGHWGDGLTTLEGKAWRERRALLRPSFAGGRVAARLPIVEACTRDLLATWEPGMEIDLEAVLRELVARIAVRTILDADLDGYVSADPRPQAGVVPRQEAIGEDYASVPGGDVTAPLVMIRPRAPRNLDAIVAIIDDRLATGEHRGDVLSELLAARGPEGQRLQREDVIPEVVQMLYAGHHTIPATLSALFGELFAHPDVSRRIHAEARRWVRPGSWTVSRLSTSHAAAALKESMRMHPPAPILYREVETEFLLAGYAFEPGTGVWVSPQLLHFDPRNFVEPTCYRPERFERRGPGEDDLRAYLPFGAGPRTCIGNRLALHQMTLMALLVAERFTLKPPGVGQTRHGIALPAAR